MARQSYYLDSRVLTAFFLAAMPFVAFGSFVVVNMARTQLRDSTGVALEQRATQTKLALEQYLADKVVQLRVIALTPELHRALAASKDPLPAAEQASRIEQDWVAGRDPRLAAAILDSPLAGWLRSVVAVRPSVRLLQLVDTRGRVIAASSRGGRLFHDGTEWFEELRTQEGDPQVYVGDMHRPRGSRLTLLDMAYPVRDAGGAWLGAVRAVLDGGDLYTVLAPVRVGRTGHAVLLRATDGLVLASDESERVLRGPMPGFDALRNAMDGFPIAESGQALFGRSRLNRGFWTLPEVRADRATVVEPSRLVGFSPVDQFPTLQWLVTVEQDLPEALAPVQSITRYLWIHFVGVFATVILLALYFSFKLERPVMEENLHLHEEHVPAAAAVAR
jgi:hypothetical protein